MTSGDIFDERHSRVAAFIGGLAVVLVATGGVVLVSESNGARAVRYATASSSTTTSTTVPACADFKPLPLGDAPFEEWSGRLQAAYPTIYGSYEDDSAQAGGSVVVFETKSDACFEKQARETLPLTRQGQQVPVSFKIVPYSYATLDSARSKLTNCLMNDPRSTVWGVGMDTSEVVINATDATKATAGVMRCGVQIATKIEVGDPTGGLVGA